MQFDLDLDDFVRVKSVGAGHPREGQIVFRHASPGKPYTVRFPDGSVGLFEGNELERVPTEEVPAE